MNNWHAGFILAVALICVSNNAMAGTIDYGNAPYPYEEASNVKGVWQQLGNVNGTDDGVTWSVDGGQTWGNGALIIGQTVTFKFMFWQLNNGEHTYDQLLAVIDSDQDKKFKMESIVQKSDTEYTGPEILTYRKIFTHNELDATMTPIYVDYVVSPILYDADDTTWLRARVTCWHTPWPEVTPYGLLGQGETEDYLLTFKNPVPEPATMLLFGTGCVGLAGIARRRQANS